MLRAVSTLGLLLSASVASAQAGTARGSIAGAGSSNYGIGINTSPFDSATVLGSAVTPTMMRDRA